MIIQIKTKQMGEFLIMYQSSPKLLLLMILSVCFILIGCNSTSGTSTSEDSEEGEKGNSVVLKFGHANSEQDNFHKGLLSFKEAVEERTNDEVIIELYPNAQLGENAEVLEQVRMGGNLMTQFSAGSLADYVPNFSILLGPFLYKDWDQAQKLLDSDLVKQWEEEVKEQTNIRVLGYYYFGERDLYTIDKPVRTPEDMKGLTIRVQPVTMYTEMIKAMGGAPTPMPWADVYNALDQGVFDGAEAPPNSVVDQRHFEQIKYYSITKHMLDPSPIGMNEQDFQNLSAEQQEIITEEAKNMLDLVSKSNLELRDESLEQLKEEGVTIIDDVDREAFIEATQEVYNQFPEWSPNLYEDVLDILNN